MPKPICFDEQHLKKQKWLRKYLWKIKDKTAQQLDPIKSNILKTVVPGTTTKDQKMVPMEELKAENCNMGKLIDK